MAEFVRVARIEDIPENDGLVVKAGDREVGLFLIEGQVHAIDNICPHRQGPLAEGILDGKVISCPWHHWTFDVTTGLCTFHDQMKVDKFPVRVEDGEILLQIGLTDEVALPPNS